MIHWKQKTTDQYKLHRLLQNFLKDLLQQMLEHVEKYEIINKNQFGFLTRKSSNDTVISLTETVNNLLEENETVVSIFLDLAKAFNSISHKIFLKKLQNMGLVRNQLQC